MKKTLLFVLTFLPFFCLSKPHKQQQAKHTISNIKKPLPNRTIEKTITRPNKFLGYFNNIQSATQWLKKYTNNACPEILIILPDGIRDPENLLSNKQEVNHSLIPYFSKARAQSYEGKLTFGRYQGKNIVIMTNPLHYYEGLIPSEIVFPLFVLNQMGVRSLITISATGGIQDNLDVGDIVMITDHINYLGENPLRGIAAQQAHDQFTDMTNAYNADYQSIATSVAKKLKINLKDGILISTTGPSYETKAEIRAFKKWGADVVGMSAIFEVIASNYLGIKVLGFAAVSHISAERQNIAINHDAIIEVLNNVSPQLTSLIAGCLDEILTL